ncbi:histidine kinase [Methylophaga pinxianii]|uniref:histidine kinase n=2 Tax=Methylophaga pinxianii TaxID=2881052 RepID=UPI001CF151D9|nr:histidine kinase [Methylophaga pinxianii]MCB2426664.1 histidine kinase [Methylophaga pinxianii]UPH45076.1 histidine kinase [Methylophaga pinxianii]
MLRHNFYFQRFCQLWSQRSLYQRWIILLSGMLLSCWFILMLSVVQVTSLKNNQLMLEQIQQKESDEETAALLDSYELPTLQENEDLWDHQTQQRYPDIRELISTIQQQNVQHGHWLMSMQVILFSVFIFLTACLINSLRQLFMNRLPALLPMTLPDNGLSTADEFSHLENTIQQLHKQQRVYHSDMAWARRTGTQLKRLMTAQAFLAEWVNQIQQEIPNEASQMRMLYSLERALDLQNVALIMTETTVVKTEEVLFSHHAPVTLGEEHLETLLAGGMFSGEVTNQENEMVNITALGFALQHDKLGIFLVEMPVSRLLDAAEITLLETLTGLLAISYRYQNYDAEGRRLAILEERAAIARELHDSLAQSLSFMKIQVSRLQSTDDQQKQAAVIKELREGLDNAYRELRELLSTFRAHMDLRGLGYAIQATIDEFIQRSSLQIKLDNRLVNCRLTVNEEFHVLHVLREALSNIVRHAGADNVSILLTLRDNGEIELTLDDDGVGFSSGESTYDHHGQTIMKERAQNLGGRIEVMSRRWGGTRVQLLFKPKLAQ